jgi:hypothetical protein
MDTPLESRIRNMDGKAPPFQDHHAPVGLVRFHFSWLALVA